MNNKVNLESQCKFERISTYKNGERKWDLGLSFVFKVEGEIGYLSISAKGINIDVDEVKRKKTDIDISSDSFLLSLKFSSSELNLVCTEKHFKLLHNDQIHEISSDSDIERAIKIINGEEIENYSEATLPLLNIEGNLSNSKIELPKYICTSFDEKLTRNLFTFLQTKALDQLSENYSDDILKRWFLILDEIEKDRGNADFAKIKRARDFVSHHLCDRKEVHKFIRKELPKAIDVETDVARFDRQDSEHINFVLKYTKLAEERVKNILKQELGSLLK